MCVKLVDVVWMVGVLVLMVSCVLLQFEVVVEVIWIVVMDVVVVIGYWMNYVVSNLCWGCIGSVVVLVFNLGNLFFVKIFDGMGCELVVVGYGLLVVDMLEGQGWDVVVVWFLDLLCVDGIILMDGLVFLVSLIGFDLLFVIIVCEWIEGVVLLCVMLDNCDGGCMVMQYLLGLGYCYIGVIGGFVVNVLYIVWLIGVIEVVGDVWLMVFVGDFSLQVGQVVVQVWLVLFVI